MPVSNLRHLRVFRAIAETGSITAAALACRVSQPAASQALAKLEALAGRPLFQRRPQGLFVNSAGSLLSQRIARAIDRLDPALADIAPRLVITASRSQLVALIAVEEAQNFTLAAARIGVSQPTVHRAIAQLEREAGRPLFQRTVVGVGPTRACSALALAARLAFAELDQATAELAELQGREVGVVVIGATPLSRSYVLPRALARFREDRPRLGIRIVDGPYVDLLARLRRGEIDIMIGALRFPPPVEDIEQEHLFDDTLVILAAADDPFVNRARVSLAKLRERPWLVTGAGTPARTQFEALFATADLAPPECIIETGSVILMREMVGKGGHLACISRAQAASELLRGLVSEVRYPVRQVPRPIGMTYRRGWSPTPAQRAFLDAVRGCS